MHYIYHIPGIKIGCTKDLKKRMNDQEFTSWEILETHEDGWLAGDREIELQKEYGLPVDRVHYMVSRENRMKMTEAAHTPEARAKRSTSLLGNTNGKGSIGIPKPGTSQYLKGRPKSEEHKNKIRLSNISKKLSEETKAKISESIAKNPKRLCTHCGNYWDPRNFSRWHGDNCKHKKG